MNLLVRNLLSVRPCFSLKDCQVFSPRGTVASWTCPKPTILLQTDHLVTIVTNLFILAGGLDGGLLPQGRVAAEMFRHLHQRRHEGGSRQGPQVSNSPMLRLSQLSALRYFSVNILTGHVERHKISILRQI
jgi:hypothetical protein